MSESPDDNPFVAINLSSVLGNETEGRKLAHMRYHDKLNRMWDLLDRLPIEDLRTLQWLLVVPDDEAVSWVNRWYGNVESTIRHRGEDPSAHDGDPRDQEPSSS